jgi:hypothetical protein
VKECLLTNNLLAAALNNVRDKAELLSLSRTKLAAGEGELASLRAVADDLGETLEGANISGKANLDLLWWS